MTAQWIRPLLSLHSVDPDLLSGITCSPELHELILEQSPYQACCSQSLTIYYTYCLRIFARANCCLLCPMGWRADIFSHVLHMYCSVSLKPSLIMNLNKLYVFFPTNFSFFPLQNILSEDLKIPCSDFTELFFTIFDY